MAQLEDTIALVTGASRGVGRGIAHELGLAGATVYVTGRSRDGAATTDDLPGTVDDAARLVTESGGHGIAVVCDHTDDDAVAALADQIKAEHGRVDLLVNNVWGGYEQFDPKDWQLDLWDQSLRRWDKMFATGVRAHYTTSRAIAPLMKEADRPLIVVVGSGDEDKYRGEVQYDVAKAADARLAFALAQNLRPLGITALTVYPGLTRSERTELFASAEELTQAHSPRFVGRAIAALASDPEVMKRTGGGFKVGHLAIDYDLTDVDGTRPGPFVFPDDL